MFTKMRKNIFIVLLAFVGLGIIFSGPMLFYRKANMVIPGHQTFFDPHSNGVNDVPEMKVFKNVDYVWDYIESGGKYQRSGELGLAAQEYLKGYRGSLGKEVPISPGQAVAGMRLIEVYELLGRFDDGLQIVNELDKKYANGEYGHQKMQDMRSRLLAAKSQALQNQQAQSS